MNYCICNARLGSAQGLMPTGSCCTHRNRVSSHRDNVIPSKPASAQVRQVRNHTYLCVKESFVFELRSTHATRTTQQISNKQRNRGWHNGDNGYQSRAQPATQIKAIHIGSAADKTKPDDRTVRPLCNGRAWMNTPGG